MGGLTAFNYSDLSDGNVILNGSFRINQLFEQTASYAVSAGDNYITDGWKINNVTGAGGATIFYNNDNGLYVSVNSAYNNTNDVLSLNQYVEGPFCNAFTENTDSQTSVTPLLLTFSLYAQNFPSKVINVPVTLIQNPGGSVAEFCGLVPVALNSQGYGYGSLTVPLNSLLLSQFNRLPGTLGLQVKVSLVPNSNVASTLAQVNVWSAFGNKIALGGSNLTTLGGFVQFSQFKLSKGLIGQTGIPIRNYDNELRFAQRYYEKSFIPGVVAAQNIGNAQGAAGYFVSNAGINNGGASVQFAVPKCKQAYTITTYNPNAANANWRNVTGGADSGVPATTLQGTRGFAIANPQVVGDAIGNSCAVHWVADARL